VLQRSGEGNVVHDRYARDSVIQRMAGWAFVFNKRSIAGGFVSWDRFWKARDRRRRSG